MAFFKRKASTNPSTLVNVEDVYVATTTITSSHNDGTDCGPRCVTWYFLVKLENNEYHELFAGKKIEKEEDTHKDDMVVASFDTPYIEKIEPLTEYLRDKSEKKMNIQLLFDFITNMNVLNSLGAFEDDEQIENWNVKKCTDILTDIRAFLL